LEEKSSRKEEKSQVSPQKKEKLSLFPKMKMTRENVFIGLAIFGLFLILGMPSLPSNKELPTGVYRSGIVISWAARDASRGQNQQLLAKIKLDNGVVFFIPFRGRYIGESLEFTEYRRKPKGRLHYRLKKSITKPSTG
jgi:hypothetical protein